MEKQEIYSHVDHTQLKAVSTWQDIRKLCEEALAHHTASVCIPPSYVARAHEHFPALNICTVIGFPLGYNTTAVKVFEAEQAIAEGAGEVDMVVNLGDVKNGDYDKVLAEIAALRRAAGDKVLKVIVETCYLTEEEKSASASSSQRRARTTSKRPPASAPAARPLTTSPSCAAWSAPSCRSRPPAGSAPTRTRRPWWKRAPTGWASRPA